MRRLLAWFAVLVGTLLVSPAVHAQRSVLVYGSGGTTSTTFWPTTGADRAVITVASDAMWRALTPAQFASYNALWIDGGNCGGSAATYQAATDTTLNWSAAITGHFEIIGSDEDFHSANPGAQKFIRNSYEYVTSGAGTGLFVSTGCVFAGAAADTPVPWLTGIGDFRVTGDGCTDGQVLEPGAGTHPVYLGISPPTTTINLPGDLSWGCFTHSHFNRHPPSFQRIFSIGGAGAGHGVVIVNDRGGCVVDADCVAGQFCNRDAAGGQPTCRTTLGNGRPCTTGTACTSGICTEGVCCSGACTGQCESCRNAGQVGLCTPTTGAPVSPRAACTNFGTTCGGSCDGTTRATCTFPGATTTCSAATCSAGTATLAAACDGTGNCPTPTTVRCNPYVCGPTACLTTCTTSADCASGAFCSSGTCTTLHTPGSACGSSAECATGHCVDGVCCDTACNGQCEACDVAGAAGTCTAVAGPPHGARTACAGSGLCGGTCDGTTRPTCSFPGGTTQCSMPSCTGGVATLPAFCDGHGACPRAMTHACAPGVCGPAGCLTMCATDADCASGFFCDGGTCNARHLPGGTCTAASQCASGNCVDGVCCDTACDGQCEACDVTGSAGTCTAVMGAPHGARTACNGMGTCGGTCNGTSHTSCSYPGTSTNCRMAACSMGTAVGPAACDGLGNCGTSVTTVCAPYACAGTTCQTMCTTDADCAGGNHCEMNRCVPNVGIGRPCSSNADCLMGVCSGGVCCDRACDGYCETCRLAGAVGTCSPRPVGTVPTTTDGGVSIPANCSACDGMRGCVVIPDAGPPVDSGVDAGMDAGGVVAYQGGGCACSTPVHTSGRSTGALALAAVALALASRRRRGA